jgi:hypothetical protein
MAYTTYSFLQPLVDKLGLVPKKSVDIVLENTTLENTLNAISKAAQTSEWKLSHEEKLEGLVIQTWEAGGFSVSGYQFVTINATQQGTNISLHIESRSRGQLADWGANARNINILEKALNNPSAVLK